MLSVWLVPVAPAIFVPLKRHWKVGVGEPVATAENVTLDPAVTLGPWGCEVMAGGTLTVRVTTALLVEPTELVMVTE